MLAPPEGEHCLGLRPANSQQRERGGQNPKPIFWLARKSELTGIGLPGRVRLTEVGVSEFCRRRANQSEASV